MSLEGSSPGVGSGIRPLPNNMNIFSPSLMLLTLFQQASRHAGKAKAQKQRQQAHKDQEQPIKNTEKAEECGNEEHIGVISLQFL